MDYLWFFCLLVYFPVAQSKSAGQSCSCCSHNGFEVGQKVEFKDKFNEFANCVFKIQRIGNDGTLFLLDAKKNGTPFCILDKETRFQTSDLVPFFEINDTVRFNSFGLDEYPGCVYRIEARDERAGYHSFWLRLWSGHRECPIILGYQRPEHLVDAKRKRSRKEAANKAETTNCKEAAAFAGGCAALAAVVVPSALACAGPVCIAENCYVGGCADCCACQTTACGGVKSTGCGSCPACGCDGCAEVCRCYNSPGIMD